MTSALVNGRVATVTKILKDETALPFANSGASPISDVYEITFMGSISLAHEVDFTTADEPLVSTLAGDVDGDGKVTVTDALITLSAILNKRAVSADVNLDGEVTLLNVVMILKLSIK